MRKCEPCDIVEAVWDCGDRTSERQEVVESCRRHAADDLHKVAVVQGDLFEGTAERKCALHLVDHPLERIGLLEQRGCRECGAVHDLYEVRPVNPRFVEHC